MQTITLKNPKECKKNRTPEMAEPNVVEDCFFKDEKWKIIWFYLKKAPERLRKIANLANKELHSKNVPKNVMSRVWYEDGIEKRLEQYSTIIWAVKPELIKRRYKPWLSHIHLEKKAERFIKLMYIFAQECEKLIQELTPELYEEQKKLLKNQKLKIWSLWTSSISNFNTAAKTHIDGANIKWANNIIYFKRENAEGGHLHLPEYDAVINSSDDALVFYPAWKSLHGVSEIKPTKKGWYRNSLVLYPLNIKYD